MYTKKNKIKYKTQSVCIKSAKNNTNDLENAMIKKP